MRASEKEALRDLNLQYCINQQQVVCGFPAAEVFRDLQGLFTLLHSFGNVGGCDHHGEWRS